MSELTLTHQELCEMVSKNEGDRPNVMRLGGDIWRRSYTVALDREDYDYVKKSYLSIDDYDYTIVAASTRDEIIKICSTLKELTKDDICIDHCNLEVPE